MIAQIYGKNASECGYCKHKDPSTSNTITNTSNNTPQDKTSFGFTAKMDVETYDALIQRNCRRSGSYYYFPYNFTCCPQFAIRVNCDEFEMRWSQGKLVRRVKRFLEGKLEGKVEDTDEDIKGGEDDMDEDKNDLEEKEDVMDSGSNDNLVCNDELLHSVEELFRFALDELFRLELFDDKIVSKSELNIKIEKNKRKKCENSFFTSICVKYFGLLKKAKSKTTKNPKDYAQELISKIPENEILSNIEYLDNGIINFDIIGYQENKNRIPKKKEKLKPNNPESLKLSISTSAFIQDEYELFEKYQTQIHKEPKEEVTRKGYDRFLCTSSLTQQSSSKYETFVTIDNSSIAFSNLNMSLSGTYHIRYELISDKSTLIAVSVIDVLPTGISSVYFFYDPGYSFLSLGVLSGIIEINLTKALSLSMKTLRFYYLGYYIHDCIKMRYKSQFHPSEILCPVTFEWCLLDERVKELMAREKCTQFLPNDSASVTTPKAEIDIDAVEALKEIMFEINGKVVPGKILVERNVFYDDFIKILVEFVKLCGFCGRNRKFASKVVIQLT